MANRSGRVLVLSAAGSGTHTGVDVDNINNRGAHIVVDITAITGTSPTLTVTVQGRDEASGKYYNILTSAALSAVGTTVLRVYPSLPATANLTAQDILPRNWRVIGVIGGTSPSVTATVGKSGAP